MDENTVRLFEVLRAELQAIRGLIQARNGEGDDQGSLLPRSMRLDIPKFTGVDPESWLLSINEYFSLLNTPADRRLQIVGFNLEGAAAEWFRWMTQNGLISDWDRFVESVRNRFGPSKYEDPKGALSKLLQIGSVVEYQSEFEKLMYRVTDISDTLLISFYISGLKIPLQRKLLVAKPTSLGDAFSLARVTEARLEDQSTTSVVSRAAGINEGKQYQNISCLFPYNIVIKTPEDKSHIKHWNKQLEDQKKKIQIQDNKNHIAEVSEAHELECNELDSICQADRKLISTYIKEIVVSAISHHLKSHNDPESSASLSHGLKILQEDTQKLMTKADASKELPDNEYERRIRQEVISANKITVIFGDIGALNKIKESLQELVMLPLKRPDLFNGGLLKPCRGVLLFIPPGTGKTMLAKAIAKEAGASFINISASTITSMWHGEDEKNVRAVFSLAAKVSPTIIFLDEVDMRQAKNQVSASLLDFGLKGGTLLVTIWSTRETRGTKLQVHVWDPGIAGGENLKQHFEGKVTLKEWGMLHP